MPATWLKREGATQEFLAESSKDAAALEAAFLKDPKSPSLVGRVRMVGEQQGAETNKDITGRIKQWMTQEPSPDSLQGSIENFSPLLQTLGMGTRMIGRAIAPDTNAGAAIDAASLAAPGILPLRAGMKALPAAARVAGRVAIPAIAGAIGGATGNEGAVEGAKTGAMAGVAGEAAGALPAGISAFYKKFGHLNTESFKTAVMTKLGPKLADAIAEDIPTLARNSTMTSTRDVAQLVTPEGGQRIVGKMFDKTEAAIVGSLSGKKIDIPVEAYEALGKAQPANAAVININGQMFTPAQLQQQNPRMYAQLLANGQINQSTGTIATNPAEAIRMVKEIRARAFKGKQDAGSFDLHALADNTSNALMSTLQGADPALYSKYVGLRDDYSKFLDLKNFLQGQTADLLPTIKGGYSVDLPKFYDTMRDSKVDPNRFSNLWDFFEGGTGAGPIERGAINPRVVVGGGVKGRVAESLRLPKRVQLNPTLEKSVDTVRKADTIADKVRGVGTRLSVPTVEDMLLQQHNEESGPSTSELLKQYQQPR